MTDEPDVQFGSPDCTCVPWTRQGGAPRYCQPGDTVDKISGWERGKGCPHHAPTPSALRDLYAAAIASYDHAVGHATDPAPGDHHHGQADAVLAVRDRELEQLRTELAMQKAISADLRVESRACGEKVERVTAAIDRVRRLCELTISHSIRVDARHQALDTLAVLDQQPAPAVPPQHLGNGANAEDCPACSGTNLPYPWVCPGESS